MFLNYKKYILIILFFGLFIFYLTSAQTFLGPSCSTGQCQGKIGVDSNSNISIGTSTPQSDTKTYIVGATSDSSAYGLKIISSNSSPVLWVRNDGRISIATTSFNYALNVSGDIYASGNLITGGNFSAALSAGNVTPGVFNSLQGGGTGAYSFLGSLGIATTSQVGLPQALSVYGGGYFSGNVGVGTTAPGYKLDIQGGQINTSGGLCIAGDCKTSWSQVGGGSQWTTTSTGIYYSGGNVGIGTTAPGYKLDVADRIRVRQGSSGSAGIWLYQTNPGNMGFIGAVDDNYIGIWGNGAGFGFAMNRANGYVGIGTTAPSYKLDVVSAGSVTARFGTASTDQVTIGGGAGKLNVGTVDPPYTINGKKYATYVPAMTGQKEETTGIVKIKNNECQIINNSKICEYKIDFNLESEGSDLWLFSKTTNLKNNFNKMTVILTPDFKGKYWYNKNNNLILSIYFEPEEEKENYEISYRLTAPRFDADKFLNQRNNNDPNEPEGLIINGQ